MALRAVRKEFLRFSRQRISQREVWVFEAIGIRSPNLQIGKLVQNPTYR
jgi:hypothetical protein